jgi:hypothetical protein
MSILFTQYLRPDGRKRGVEIDMLQEVEDLAERFIAAGGRYECEELTPGHASLTAVYEVDGEDQDIAIEVCSNGPEVPERVEKLVRRSILRLKELGCSELDTSEHLDEVE